MAEKFKKEKSRTADCYLNRYLLRETCLLKAKYHALSKISTHKNKVTAWTFNMVISIVEFKLGDAKWIDGSN